MLAATGLAVAGAAPVASADLLLFSGAYWAPCHAGVQSPVTHVSARTASLAAAPSGIATDADSGAQDAYVDVQSAATGGPVQADSRLYAIYQMPVSIPCRDLDIGVEMRSSARLNADEPFYYGRNQSAVLIETGRNLADPRPVQMEAGQLILAGIQLSSGHGKADADVNIRLLELRPQQPARTLFDLVLSTPDVAGQGLLAFSSIDQALADEIAAAFSYDALNDLYNLSSFSSGAMSFAAESLTDPYRNLFLTLDTALSAPEPLPQALLVLALTLLWRQRQQARGRPCRP